MMELCKNWISLKDLIVKIQILLQKKNPNKENKKERTLVGAHS